MVITIGNEFILEGPVPLVPIAKGTAGQQLFEALQRYQHLPAAVICAETHEQVSYKQLLEDSCQLACGFIKYGLAPGSVISIFSENNQYFYLPVLASLYLGITVAPLSPDYIGDELYHATNISKPQILFCSKRTLKQALELQNNLNYIEKVVILDSQDATEIRCLGNFFADAVNFQPQEFDSNEQLAFIMCSSGTTGLPKGIMLTHRNLSVRFALMKDPILGMISEPETRVLSMLPMYHIGGLGFSLTYLILGFRNVMMKRFSMKTYLRLIQDYKIETSFVAPPIMNLLSKHSSINKYDLSSLREIGCGAAPLSKDIIVDVLQRLPSLKEVRQAYGLTETTINITFSPRGDAKVGSSGKLYPFCSAKVIDLDTQRPLGPYKNGELCFKSGLIMKGYLNQPSETSKAIDQDGWLHTGDIGYYDQDQHFYIVDRIKELIKFKGYPVSPTELETVLLKHPKIKDAAVIGIDDKHAGELSRAYVVKKSHQELNEEEVANFVNDQVSYPKRLHGGVVFIDEMPRIPSGKIAKKRLKELSLPKRSKL